MTKKQYAEEVETKQQLDDGWIIRRDEHGVLHLHDKNGMRWGTITSISVVSGRWSERQVLDWQVTMVPGLEVTVGPGVQRSDIAGSASHGPRAIGHTRKLT